MEYDHFHPVYPFASVNSCFFVLFHTIYKPLSTSDMTSPDDAGVASSLSIPLQLYELKRMCLFLQPQKRQTIRLTLIDFELDVKKGGHCNDYMEIRGADQTYFSDCGSLGKEQFHIKSDSAVISFSTGTSGLTHRGFLVHFEGELLWGDLVALSFIIRKVVTRLHCLVQSLYFV